MEKRLDTELGEGGGRLGSWGLPPPSLLCWRSQLQKPCPPAASPATAALLQPVRGRLRLDWLGLERTWRGSCAPLRTPGSCWRLPGRNEGGPAPERPMVSSFGPREGAHMAQGLGAGSRPSPGGCLVLGAPPAGEGRLGKSPLEAAEPALRAGAAGAGPSRAFASRVGGRESAGWAEPWGPVCARVHARVCACVPVGEIGQMGVLRIPGPQTFPLGRPSSSTNLFSCHCPLTHSGRGVTPGWPPAVCPGWGRGAANCICASSGQGPVQEPADARPGYLLGCCGGLSARAGKPSRVLVSLGSLD